MKDTDLKQNQFEDYFITEVEGYTLWKEDRGRKGYLYTIYDPDMAQVASWSSYNDIEKSKDIKKSPIYKRFIKLVRDDQENGQYKFDDIDDDENPRSISDDGYDDDDEYLTPRSGKKTQTGYNYPNGTRRYSYWDDDYWDDYGYGGGYSSPYWKGGSYKPAPKEKGFFDQFTKSNTVVFHKTDNSTDMLAQIYEGKGWDVFRETYKYDQEELFKVVDAHERVVCLGHGSGYGLIGMFGPEMAPHLKDKKLFVIWCNADAYFEKYSIGQGQFITGNMPSEVWECSAAGCGKISKQLMLDNITYWSKLCADVCEQCLEGNVDEGVEYIRKNYLEKYGNHPVTIYNCNRTQRLGTKVELPAYEFKGEPLGDADKPVGGFDEKAFLEHPTEKASECPRVPGYVEPEPEWKKYAYHSSAYDSQGSGKVTKAGNNVYVQQSLFDFEQYEKDYKEVKPFYDELAKGMTYDELFHFGIDTKEKEFVEKAQEKFSPRISKGDVFDMFYDWAEEKMREPGFYKPKQIATSAPANPKPLGYTYTPSAEGKKVCDFWETFLGNYTKDEFLYSKHVVIKNELVKKALEKFPNDYTVTKLTDDLYKDELEALYDDWSKHLDNSKFKKPQGDA